MTSLPFSSVANSQCVPAQRRHLRCCLCLLAIHAALLLQSAAVDSPTVDEPHHLLGGLQHLFLGRSLADPGNPPLAGLCAALAVLWQHGFESIGNVTARGSDLYFFINDGRVALIPFSILGGFVCFQWASDLYGGRSGLVATALWSFCPSILATGHLINGDMVATACGIAAFYGLWRWLDAPSMPGALFAGCLFGLAQASKYVWIINYVTWPLLIAVFSCLAPLPARQWSGHIAVGVLGALVTLHLVYTFEVISALPGGSADSLRRSSSDIAQDLPRPLRYCAFLLPSHYLSGMVEVRSFLERTNTASSYLCGRWQPGGFAHYYPAALAIKLPIGLIVLAATRAVRALRVTTPRLARAEAVLFVGVVSVLTFVTFGTGSQQMVRYAFPTLPFLIILASGACFRVRHRAFARSLGCLALWGCLVGVIAYPHPAAYCNEIAGGPTGARRCLLGADIDSGQGLSFLARWQDDHPHGKPVRLAYAGPGSPSWAGVAWTSAPIAPSDGGVLRVPPGWYAVSTTLLHDRSHYRYLDGLHPTVNVGNSLYVYHLKNTSDFRVQPLGEPGGRPPPGQQ